MKAGMNQLLQQAEVKESLDVMGAYPIGGTPEKMNALVSNEIKMWTQVVKDSGIQAD